MQKEVIEKNERRENDIYEKRFTRVRREKMWMVYHKREWVCFWINMAIILVCASIGWFIYGVLGMLGVCLLLLLLQIIQLRRG